MPQGSIFSAGYREDLRFNFAGIARSFAHRILLFSIKSSILCNSQRIHFGTIIFCMYHDVNLADNRDNKKKHTLWGGLTVTRENPRGLLHDKSPRGCCFISPLSFFLFGLRLPLLALQDKGCGENLHRQSPFSYIFRGFAFSYTWGSAASMIQYVTAEPHL